MLVRVSGEAFAEALKNEMWKAMDPPPKGTRLEEAPRTLWGNCAPVLIDPSWAAVGNCTVTKPDACSSDQPRGVLRYQEQERNRSNDCSGTYPNCCQLPPTDPSLTGDSLFPQVSELCI